MNKVIRESISEDTLRRWWKEENENLVKSYLEQSKNDKEVRRLLDQAKKSPEDTYEEVIRRTLAMRTVDDWIKRFREREIEGL